MNHKDLPYDEAPRMDSPNILPILCLPNLRHKLGVSPHADVKCRNLTAEHLKIESNSAYSVLIQCF
jgi:hypothetical protein